LIIVAIAIAIGWGLSRLFVPLAIIPLPIVIFFGALALPLRKDQPMEIYMAAIVSFYLKPRRRLWRADGIQSLVEITAPKTVEVQRVKDLSQSEAERRLSYLADIVDTGGWAIRGVGAAQSSSPMQNDVFFEAQQAEDILATDGGVARSIDSMITESDQRHRQEIIDRMHEKSATAIPAGAPILADPYIALTPTITAPTPPPAAPAAVPTQVNYNPYPSAMHQSIITPLSEQPPVTPASPVTPQPYQAVPVTQQPVQTPTVAKAPQPEPLTTSEKTVSPDIISLANNPDLSIETIARQANRIHQLEADEGEVVISLR
jgi:hypothetical protein